MFVKITSQFTECIGGFSWRTRICYDNYGSFFLKKKDIFLAMFDFFAVHWPDFICIWAHYKGSSFLFRHSCYSDSFYSVKHYSNKRYVTARLQLRE